MADPTPDSDRLGAVDRRQLLLVCLCILALVVAAFLAPPPVSGGVGSADGPGDGPNPDSPGSEPGDGPGGEPGDGPGTGPGDGPGDGPGRIVGDGDRPLPIPGNGGDRERVRNECGVVLSSAPTPGATVMVRVYYDLEPVSGAGVWFNDRYVGETDETGSVTGRVPYERTLNVTVEQPRGEDCIFVHRRTGAGVRSAGATGDGAHAAVGVDDSPAIAGVGTSRVQSTPDNDSGEYQVDGRVRVAVRGAPYPGATVTVLAAVSGVPMRGATVRVDGDRVGTTDDRGRHEITLPRGEQRVRVTVSRGDFSGQTTVDVRLLDVWIESREGLAVPGERAVVVAAIEGERVAGAPVSLDGERIGTTGPDGTVSVTLPSDPEATFAVGTGRQTATVQAWTAYVPTVAGAVAIILFGVSTTTWAARRRDRRAAGLVAGGWTLVGVTYAALAVAELPGLAAALVVDALVVLYFYREAVLSGGESTANLLAAFLGALRRGALWIVGVLEAAVDWAIAAIGRVTAWLASLPLSATALASRLGAWLAGLPGRAAVALGRVLSPVRVAAGALALAAVGGATYLWDAEGGAVATVAVAVALLAWRWYRRDHPADGGSDAPTAEATAGSTPSTGPESAPGLPSLRELWRRFARWVVPARWRTRTPGEIQRAAVDRGFPREPVETLTEAFREVEYGDHPSAGRVERAREAFSRLREEADGSTSDGSDGSATDRSGHEGGQR